jgi:hypothetical protein
LTKLYFFSFLPLCFTAFHFISFLPRFFPCLFVVYNINHRTSSHHHSTTQTQTQTQTRVPLSRQSQSNFFIRYFPVSETYRQSQQDSTSKMCYKVVERYSVCKCLYFQHSIDPCQAYGQRGHCVQEKTVLVGYACETHSTRGSSSSSSPTAPGAPGNWLDSGYSSEKGSCR